MEGRIFVNDFRQEPPLLKRNHIIISQEDFYIRVFLGSSLSMHLCQFLKHQDFGHGKQWKIQNLSCFRGSPAGRIFPPSEHCPTVR
jgi:hypothetical protein